MNGVISNYNLFLALLSGIFVGGVAGYLGSLMAVKNMSLVGDALGHLALPGISLALLYQFDVSLGAFIFLALGIVLIYFIKNLTRLPFEAIIAVIFAISLAVSFLILPREEINIALLGDISKISLPVTIFSCLVSVIIFLLINRIYPKIILMNISEDLAISNKINTKLINLIYLACVGLTVALGIRIVGGLMVAALVAIPAATSYNISMELFHYSYTSLILGSISCILGILLYIFFGFSIGPFIIIASGFFFLVSLFFKKR